MGQIHLSDVIVLYIYFDLGEINERASGFVDKEKEVLITVAEKIGSTLGQVAALGQVARKASRAMANQCVGNSNASRARNPLKPSGLSAMAHGARRVRRAADKIWNARHKKTILTCYAAKPRNLYKVCASLRWRSNTRSRGQLFGSSMLFLFWR